jgi:hypothetical protein
MQPFISYHLDLIQPYIEMYYDVLPVLITKLDRQRAEAFMRKVCPAIRASDNDLKRV